MKACDLRAYTLEVREHIVEEGGGLLVMFPFQPKKSLTSIFGMIQLRQDITDGCCGSAKR